MCYYTINKYESGRFMLKYVLFDLDGTLLPMNQEEFVNCYFKLLCKSLKPHYPDSQKLIKSVWAGTNEMMNNDGTKLNSEVFWEKMTQIYGDNVLEDKHLFDSFYKNEFNLAKEATKPNKLVYECIELLTNKGYKLILATNPIFPLIATQNRIKWAGLSSDMFDYITSYENSSFSKSSINYYKEVLSKIGAEATECLMVGNDVLEDMKVSQIGMDTYLIKDCIINSNNIDISKFKQGDFEGFKEYILNLPDLK